MASAAQVGGRAPTRPRGARNAPAFKIEPPRTAKMAERVAAEIETTIIRRGWRVGHIIGSEQDLLDTYGVSRAVLREAIRILEHQSIAKMRKGPGGGLVVTEPSAAVVSRAIALYLRHQRIAPSQLLDVRIGVESTMLALAHRNLTPRDVIEIRRHLEDEGERPGSAHHSLHEFHHVLARIADNPAMELFVQCLVMLTDAQGSEGKHRRPTTPEISHAAHVEIGEALIAGDLAAAQRAMAEHIRSLEPNLIQIP
jgi:DNA-binding FadR family transcriptional regulator